jgi:hypothetical protein
VSDIEKLKLEYFGQWLTEQTVMREANLFSVCANTKLASDAIRLEYGKVESYKYILQALSFLFQKEPEQFRKEYLNIESEETKDDDSRDGNESRT